MTQLSTVKPDIEDLIQQLTAALSTKDSWKDLFEAGTGQTLIEFMAAMGTLQNFNIERGVQELFPLTANIDTSIYATASMLGVNPRRKVSAKTFADLSLASILPGAVTIPKYSQFKIEDVLFYNPSSIVFPASTLTVTGVELEQGEITKETFTSDGTAFQIFNFGSNFTSNENLMYITVSGSPYSRERRSLIKHTESDQVFLELTLPDGSVRIVFGNGTFGIIPINGSSIVATHAVSVGSDANIANSGLNVDLIDSINTIYGILSVSGSTTSGIVGGAEKTSASELRYTSPRLFASAGNAINRSTWRAISIDFPGKDIVDAIAYGEFELGSVSNVFMNVVNVVLLTNDGTPLTSPEKDDFKDYMSDTKHISTQIEIIDPVAVNVDVDIEVYYFDGQDPVSLQTEINNQIEDLFSIKLDSLNKEYYLSDIIDLVKDNEGVDYVILNSPTSPVLLDYFEFANLNSINITMVLSTR